MRSEHTLEATPSTTPSRCRRTAVEVPSSDHTGQTIVMERYADPDAARWITDATTRRGFTVARLVPPTFAAYTKILHPIHRNPEPTEGPTWNSSPSQRDALTDEMAGLFGSMKRAEKFMSDAVISSIGGGDDLGERVRWSELAAELDIPVTPGIHGGSFVDADGSWPSTYFGPDEGYLPDDHVQRLADLLGSNQPHYFWYDEYTPHGLDGEDDEVLYRGALSELPGTLREHDREPPTYWWPEDRSWCLCVDWDQTFSLLAGPRDLIEAVCADTLLETVPIGPHDEYMGQKPKVAPTRRRRSIFSRRRRNSD